MAFASMAWTLSPPFPPPPPAMSARADQDDHGHKLRIPTGAVFQ